MLHQPHGVMDWLACAWMFAGGLAALRVLYGLAVSILRRSL